VFKSRKQNSGNPVENLSTQAAKLNDRLGINFQQESKLKKKLLKTGIVNII
jgi:hypothetical protein